GFGGFPVTGKFPHFSSIHMFPMMPSFLNITFVLPQREIAMWRLRYTSLRIKKLPLCLSMFLLWWLRFLIRFLYRNWYSPIEAGWNSYQQRYPVPPVLG